MTSLTVPGDSKDESRDAQQKEERPGGFMSSPHVRPNPDRDAAGAGAIPPSTREDATGEPDQPEAAGVPPEEADPPPAGGFMSSPVHDDVTTEQALETFSRSAARGAYQAGGAATGLIAGAKIGLLGGPAAPVTVPLAAATGLLSGWLFGDGIADIASRWGLSSRTSPDKLPPHLRPYGYAGEVFGGGLAFSGSAAVMAQGAARLPSTTVGRFLNRTLDFARDNPRVFMGSEAFANFWSGTARGVAETHAPGDKVIGFGAEVVGGLVNPMSVLTRHTPNSVAAIRNFVISQSASGQQTRAGEKLRTFLIEAGEDPDVIINALRVARARGDLPQLGGTADQQTGSLGLARVAAILAQHDQRFQSELGQRATEDLQTLSTLIAAMRGSGDPALVRRAAEEEAKAMASILEAQLAIAQREAVEAAQRISADTPAAREALSVQVAGILDNSLQRARAVERELYAAVPQELRQARARFDSVFGMHAYLTGEMLETQTLPKELADAILNRQRALQTLEDHANGVAGPDGNPIGNEAVAKAHDLLNIGSLIKLRQAALELGRGAARSTDESAPRHARQYHLIADAARRDLVASGALTRAEQTPGTEFLPGREVRRGQGGRFSERTALDEANDYSAALNDTYVRAFVGRLEDVGPHGMALPPELLLRRAIATGDEAAELQLREIEEATRFLQTQGRVPEGDEDAVQENVNLVMQAQDRLLRLAAAASRDRNNVVNADSLQKFIDKAGTVLNRFPGIRQDLERAVSSADNLKAWERSTSGASDFMDSASMLSRLINVENPQFAVRGAISSDNPVQSLTGLIKLSQTLPAGGTGISPAMGMRAAIWDDAMDSATRPDGTISFVDLASAFMDPIRGVPNNKSVMEVMVETGLLPKPEADRIEMIIRRGVAIMRAANEGTGGADLFAESNWIIDFAVRLMGTEAGTSFARAGDVGHSLVVAQRSAQLARDTMLNLPTARIRQVMIRALSGEPLKPGGEPFSLLIHLLEPHTTTRGVLRSAQALHSYLFQAGFFGVERTFFQHYRQSESRDSGAANEDKRP